MGGAEGAPRARQGIRWGSFYLRPLLIAVARALGSLSPAVYPIEAVCQASPRLPVLDVELVWAIEEGCPRVAKAQDAFDAAQPDHRPGQLARLGAIVATPRQVDRRSVERLGREVELLSHLRRQIETPRRRPWLAPEEQRQPVRRHLSGHARAVLLLQQS